MKFFLTMGLFKLLELVSKPIMSTEKIKKKMPNTQIIDDVYEEYQEKKISLNNTNALVREPAFENKLEKIEQQLNSIVDRQKNGVSAEFNALMDGYVNKANESQEYKVKAHHLESLYEDLKIESKTLTEDNKRLKADLEATKEALRMSESDIKRLKQEADHTKNNFQEQIANLQEEREKLKSKLKEVQTQNDQNIQSYNNIKSELLEQKYKVKQFEQEKQVEDETQKRTSRETTKLIDELKEKLELRTREVEYKDALLNQLIKQVSVEDNFRSKINPVTQGLRDYTEMPKTEAKAQVFFDDEKEAVEIPKVENHMTLKQSISSRFAKKPDGSSAHKSSSWGPFKRR
jgi:chromosome segregation ATPase